MIFAPHILKKKTVTGGIIDEKGNPIPDKVDWVEVGKCRCDDNGQQIKVSVNGILYDYNYHVVYTGEIIPIGTEIQISDGERIRGEGKVIKCGKANYFNYAEIWM